jgi:hypothetical protein
MSTIQTISLTTLNRNTAVLHTATIERRTVLLTQHGRATLAVINVEWYAQLLRIAEHLSCRNCTSGHAEDSQFRGVGSPKVSPPCSSVLGQI